MRETLFIVIVLGFTLIQAGILMAADQGATTKPTSVLGFTVDDNAGKPVDLSRFKGRVLLIVNTASRCGYTPQYADLEKVYEQYKDKGLSILAFPANEFNQQEPGTNAEIREFCTSKYNVSFDLFAKIVVKGPGQAPLYQFLTDKNAHAKTGGDIQWNFTKFLIGRDGNIVARYEPKVKPTDQQVVTALETELAKPQ
jgi:glutathione peroxidase